MEGFLGFLFVGMPFACFAFAFFCWYVKDKSGKIFYKHKLPHQSSGYFISISDIKHQIATVSDTKLVEALEATFRYRKMGYVALALMFIFPLLVGFFVW